MARQADGTIYINTAISTDGFKAGGKEVEAAARRMAKTVDGIGASAKSSLQRQTDAFAKQNQAYARQEKKVDSLKDKLRELSKQKIATKEYAALEKELAKLGADYDKLAERQQRFLATGGKAKSTTCQRMEYDLDRLDQKQDAVIAKMRQMEEAGTAYQPADTSVVDEKLSTEQEKLLQMNNSLGTSYQALKDKVSQMTGESAQNVGFLRSALNGLKMAAHAPISAIKALGGAILGLPGKALNKVVSGLDKVKSAALSAAKTVGGTLASAIKKGVSGMLGLNKGAAGSDMNFKKLAKTVLKYAFGIRSLYILVRKLKAAMKEGLTNLAQYDDTTNASISSLMSALTQLKNSLATAFAPILNVVAPILTSFINMLSRAATYVGMLIAALTGQKTFAKATAVQQDYAASLGDTADSAQDAADATQEAAEEAEGYLSPIDTINKINSDKDKNGIGASGVTPGGYTAPTPQDMFETAPIEGSVKGLADKIKKYIAAEDWEGLGAFFASGINAGLQKVYDAINWDNVGPKITYFVDAFTRTFNSLVDNLDWGLLGRTIGAGINTMVNTLNLLIEGIDWVNLGGKLAEGANGIVDEVNWENLGRLIGNKFMILPKTALGFVKKLKWGSLGTAIGKALNGVVKAIDLSAIGELFGRALTGVFQAAISFAATFDWKALGMNIYRGINAFFAATDWAIIGRGISDFVKGLLDTIITAVEGTNWVQIGESIKTLLVNIDWAGVITRLAELFGAACAGLAALIGGFIGDAFVAAKEYFQEKVEQSGGDIIAGVFIGITDALASIGQWIKDNIFDPFIEGFKNAFGINSPSTVMAKQGGYIISGLLKGLKDKISSVLEWVSKLPGWIKDKLGDASQWLLEKGRNALAGLKAGFSEKWANFLDWMGENKTAIVDKFKDLKEKLTTKGRQIITGLKSGVSEKWSDLSSYLVEKKNAIISKFSNIRDKMAKVGKNIVSGIIDGISSVWGTLRSWASSIASMFTFNTGGYGGGRSIGGVTVISTRPQSPVFPVPEMDIPYLATGAVIPPNAPFAAMLGDQKRGNNIEAPEALIRKIVREESNRNQGRGGTIHVHVDLNGREIAETVITEMELKRIRSGQPVLGGV